VIADRELPLSRAHRQPSNGRRPVAAGIHEQTLLDELLEDLGSGWIGQRRLA
jgi:hypothetical protein